LPKPAKKGLSTGNNDFKSEMFCTASKKQEKLQGKVQKTQATCDKKINRLMERCDVLGQRFTAEAVTQAAKATELARHACKTAESVVDPQKMSKKDNGVHNEKQLDSLKKKKEKSEEKAKGIQEALKNFGMLYEL
jgi:hypothetical protein